MEEQRAELTLSWSYGVQGDGNSHYLENVLNILLFVPIDVLCRCLSKKIKWWMVLLLGLLVSSSIEILQYVLQKGIFEFDDIMHNTVGAMVGYCIFVVIAKTFKTVR